MVTPIEVDWESFSQPETTELGRGTTANQGILRILGEITVSDEPGITFSPTLPSKVMLAFLRDGRLRVREAIEVKILEEEGQIIAEAEELNEFGSGDNQTEAITDLQYAIADLYFTLEAEQAHLGKELQRVWGTLQAKMDRR